MDKRNKLLKRNKAIATTLMLGAALLFVIARSQKGSGAWEWIAAFSEAAMVGALADWFAVVALFRHPLGLPIPHTAIIKNKKEAIANNLAIFIRDKFLPNDTLIAKLRSYNPAEHLALYLMSHNQARSLATGLTQIFANSLDFIEDERFQQFLRSIINNRLNSFDLSSSASTLLETVRKGHHHQLLLNDLLHRVAGWIASEDVQAGLAKAIDDMCAKEYPLLVAFIPNRDQFSRGVGEKIVKRINVFIQEVNSDPEHNMRHRFDSVVAEFTERLKSDSVLREKVESIKNGTINNQAISGYTRSLVSDLKTWLEADLCRSESEVQAKIMTLLTGVGAAISNNQGIKDALNEHFEKLLLQYGDTLRTYASQHISDTVQSWNSQDYTEEIELSIGSDLQFIRMNGTLVGGCIGLLLHAISLLL